LYLCHCYGLPGSDLSAWSPGSGDGCRVAQFDVRKVTVKVAECLGVYGGPDGAVQILGCG
jgi:hypothetical protein